MKKIYFKFFIFFIVIFCIAFIYIQIGHLKKVIEPDRNNNISVLKEINLGSTGYKAIAILYDGGATTDFSTQVSIIKTSDSKIPNPSNIFIGNHSKKINILWENNTLKIYHDCSKDDIFFKKNNFNDIKIMYETL
ncbi:hypothetical protein ACXAUS_004165 [Clostridium sporogenes]|uniref:hypothetical protein n=1 Tax=Clostridium sporogenes TaxID=1509 RepID=UPI003F8EB410